jgi:hypothetical protein
MPVSKYGCLCAQFVTLSCYGLQAYYMSATSLESNFDCHCLKPTFQRIMCNGAMVCNFDCYGLRVVTLTITVDTNITTD